ncbi:MAG: molybdate ABC transporter permease subunit [Mycoplasmatales bacterium]
MNNIFDPLFISLQITLFASIFATILGISIAYFMTNYNFKFKFVLEILFLLPIVLPPSVIGYLLLISVGNNSPIYNIIILIFGHSIIFTKVAAILSSTIVAFPIIYQASKIGFNNVNKDLKEVAVLENASNFTIFKKITLPLSKFAIISGITLGTARAFGEFGATLMVAGNIPGKTQTLPIAIYMAMSQNDMQLANIYVLTMITISIIFLIIIHFINKK